MGCLATLGPSVVFTCVAPSWGHAFLVGVGMDRRLFYLTKAAATELTEDRYKDESELQELLAANPDFLSRAWSDKKTYIYLVQREMPAHSEERDSDFYADHLFIDSEGVPIIVEAKLSTNSEIHSRVISQMIDYACRARTWGQAVLRDRFLASNGSPEIADSFDSDAFWDKVSQNLEIEHFRLVLVADKIPDSVRAQIEFLDRSMKEIEVYGVELRKYTSEGHELVSVNVVGNIIDDKKVSPYALGPRWTDEGIRDAIMKAAGLDQLNVFDRFVSLFSEAGFTTQNGRGSSTAYISYRYRGIFLFWLGVKIINGDISFEIDMSASPLIGSDIFIKLQSLPDGIHKVTKPKENIKFDLDFLCVEDNMEKFRDILLNLPAFSGQENECSE